MIRTPAPRPGSILPMLALTVVGLFSFLALAIDLGLLAVARTECQNAADAAALAATRTLNNKPGRPDNDRSIARTAGEDVVKNNVLLAANFAGTDIESIRFGTYEYNTGTQQFEVSYPAARPPGRSWTATEVTVGVTQPAFFARVLGTATMATGARAVAVHRPRDIAVVMDLTGSMRYGTTLNGGTGAFLSADPVYPQFGHFARYTNYGANNPNAGTNGGTTESSRHNPFFTTAPFVRSTGELNAPNNFTVPTAGGPACVKDFHYDPGNLANPAAPAAVVDAALVGATPTIPKAFHHYEPGVASAGNPDAYIAPTYDYSGWAYNPTGFTHYPCPETFKDQSAADYLGDRHPRKQGKEGVTANRTAAWDPLAATGAAVNLAEYLGWTAAITTGAGTPNPNTVGTLAGYTGPAATGRAWANFRDATWEANGYDLDVPAYITARSTRDPRSAMATPPLKPAAQRFKGYSMGPGYWGKTFFMWPPDPRAPAGNPGDAGYVAGDWRRRFFTRADGSAFNPQADNDTSKTGTDAINEPLMKNGGGSALLARNDGEAGTPLPAAGINYAAILKWIKQPPLALPPNLRAGRILYYSSIPDDVNTSTGTADQKTDKAFWKGYIDYVLCNYVGDRVRSDPANNYRDCPTDFEKNGWPNGAASGVFQSDLTQLAGSPADPRPYLHYLDNPSRPRSQFWFGPVTLMAFLANGNASRTNAWAGTVHESQAWQLKAGMNSALDDIKNNHPNDAVGIAYFSHGAYGHVSVALGQEWQVLKDALYYPQTLIDNGKAGTDRTQEFRAFTASNTNLCGNNVPNAQGGTDPNTGLAMGYNILSPAVSPTSIRRPSPPSPYADPLAPRSGRRGAAKVVIFETDGVPNAYRDLQFNAQGYNSYYSVTGGGGSVANGDAQAIDPALAVVGRIVAQAATTAGGDSGLSTPNSPARVYAIGFGDLFSTPSATFQPTARKFLLDIQKRGKTSGPNDAAIPDSQIITGASTVRIESLRTCLERIMQSGVQVTLIE